MVATTVARDHQEDSGGGGVRAPVAHPSHDTSATPAAPGGDPRLTVVLPVFNEEGNLRELCARLVAVLEGTLGVTFELIFVDDGSSDGSFDILAALHAEDDRVRVLRFARNFGHHIAITAGLDAARGELVAFMDSDLQDQPEALPILFEKLEEGYDLVRAIRKEKKHSLFKRLTSATFQALMNRLVSGFQIDTAIFRIARRPLIDAVKACRERDRFVAGLFSWVGFRQTSVEVPHGARFSGETKYTLRKMVRLALNSITAFSRAPLRLANAVGLMVSVLSFVGGLGVIYLKLRYDTAVVGWPSTIVLITFLGGVQLLCLGIIGEYVGRIYHEVQRRPLYVLADDLDHE